jgi:NADH-quinone oxidoreductase subunit C
MRRDYVEPDDFEYEPTAHDDVFKRTQARQAVAAVEQESEGGA